MKIIKEKVTTIKTTLSDHVIESAAKALNVKVHLSGQNPKVVKIVGNVKVRDFVAVANIANRFKEQ